VTTIQVPPSPRARSGKQIVALRHCLKQSQSGFARLLNVSVRTVQAWEQEARTPSEAALKLIAVAKKHPEALFDAD
jgi:putative transcriptional regulator